MVLSQKIEWLSGMGVGSEATVSRGRGGGSWGRGAGPGSVWEPSLLLSSCHTSADGGPLSNPLFLFPQRPWGSTPGWGGGGPDACDWPGQHLGRPAPPPPSCWEQLLLSPRAARRWVAWLGLWRCCWGRVGNGWRRPGSVVACSYWSKSQRPLAIPAGTQSELIDAPKQTTLASC